MDAALSLQPASSVATNIDVFTNTDPLWHPLQFKSVYGGQIAAQSLRAAQLTVPESFFVHSQQTQFLAGAKIGPDENITYHVDRVRESRSYCTRIAHARQQDRHVATTTLSFVRKDTRIKPVLQHAQPFDPVSSAPADDHLGDGSHGDDSPFVMQRIEEIASDNGSTPYTKRERQWIKSRHIMADTARQAHEASLVCMSDSNILGTAARAHGLGPGTSISYKSADNQSKAEVRVALMASLSHTVYFHADESFRADQWLYVESESPWTGLERALVIQRMYTARGVLLATCVQEVRKSALPSKDCPLY